MRRRVVLGMMSAAASVLAAGVVFAQPKRGCERATVWTSDACLHIAFVRGGVIEPRKSRCDDAIDGYVGRFGHFSAIDRWGKIVGNVMRPETAPCAPMALMSGTRGTGIYVRTDGASWSVPSAYSDPPPDVRRSLDRLLKGGEPVREILFFHARKEGAPPELAAVTTRDSVKILYLDGEGQFRVAYQLRVRSARWPIFRVAAIVDMNGDGVPEVILHFSEYASGRGHEILLGPSHGGRRYAEVSNNEDEGP
jgi:hypothetical protein